MAEDPVQRLREQIAAGRAVFLIGAGVSVQVTGGNPASSWLGFIEQGVAAAADLTASEADLDQWRAQVRHEIDSHDPERRLAGEDLVVARLGGHGSPAFAQWLEDSVGSLAPVDPAPVKALVALGVPLLTLNYDNLIEDITDWPAVTWKQPTAMRDVVRGAQDGIVHVHGHWRDPSSVVIGTAEYARIVSEREARALIEAVSYSTTLVLVGFGHPLDTEQFEPLRAWLTTSPGKRHVRLVSGPERAYFSRPEFVEERRHLQLVEYGPTYDDLASFLRSLAPRTVEASADDGKAVATSADAAAPRWYRPGGFFFGGVGVMTGIYGVAELLGATALVSALGAGCVAAFGDARFAGRRTGWPNLVSLLAAIVVTIAFAGFAIAAHGDSNDPAPIEEFTSTNPRSTPSRESGDFSLLGIRLGSDMDEVRRMFPADAQQSVDQEFGAADETTRNWSWRGVGVSVTAQRSTNSVISVGVSAEDPELYVSLPRGLTLGYSKVRDVIHAYGQPELAKAVTETGGAPPYYQLQFGYGAEGAFTVFYQASAEPAASVPRPDGVIDASVCRQTITAFWFKALPWGSTQWPAEHHLCT